MLRHNLFLPSNFALLLCTITAMQPSYGDEPVTLIGTIVKWRYPDAEIGKSEMSDAATANANGERIVPSSMLKTTMTTPDPVDRVLAHYRELLKRSRKNDEQLKINPTAGRSVVISDESGGRPFAFHTIIVNSDDVSTTLVVTRGKDEELTHITWKQYLRHKVSQ